MPRKRMIGLFVLKEATDGERLNGNSNTGGNKGLKIVKIPKNVFFVANFQILRPTGVCPKENCF